MSILVKRIFVPVLPIVLAIMVCQPRYCQGQDQEKLSRRAAKTDNAQAKEPVKAPAPEEKANQVQPGDVKLDSPEPVPDEQLVPVLRTVPVRRDQPRRSYNYQLINTALLPRDKEGIWVLDFAFKPLRIRDVESPRQRSATVHYLYYKSGQPHRKTPHVRAPVHHGQRRGEKDSRTRSFPRPYR